VQDEGHRHVARLVGHIEQEVRVQMQLAVVFDIKARAGLKVCQILGVRQIESELAAHPLANTRRWGNQIDPDRLDFGKIELAFDDDLAQTTIVQLEGIDDDFFAGSMPVTDQHFLYFIGEQFENIVLTSFVDFLPGNQTIVFRQSAENERDGDDGQTRKQIVQFADMLLLNQAFNQLVTRHVLAPNHFFDEPVLGEQLLHIGQVLLEHINFGRGFVGHGASMLQCKNKPRL